MAKKTAAKKPVTKKPRRRLKRTARRSLAAVLMITAVVVAAIPVPENVAAPEGGISTYEDAPDPLPYGYPDSLAGTVSNANLAKPGAADTVYTANIIQALSDGSYQMDWQFRFKMTTVNYRQRGIISEYNNSYPEETVTLNPNVTCDYVQFSQTQFENYFNDASAPTYTCTNPESIDQDAADFFNAYFETAFTTYKNGYEAAYREYEENHQAWLENPDLDNRGDEPKRPSFTRSINDLELDDKYVYFCDHYQNGLYKGYKLALVIDSANPAGGTNTRVYIPQRLEKRKVGEMDDAQGFVYRTDASIIGIGNEAFKDTRNVHYLTVPPEIKYIGTSAFENSFLREITLVNTDQICDKAFKNCNDLTRVDMQAGVIQIGTECFYKTGLTEMSFPSSMQRIGHGAFADCSSLQKVDFSKISGTVAIGDYAFYNTAGLNEVDFLKAGSDGVTVSVARIGEAAFAVEDGATGNMTEFLFPTTIKQALSAGDVGNIETEGLGDFVLAGRMNLEHVTMPADFGRNPTPAAKVPDNTFYNCFNLDYVKFPADGTSCGYATFDPRKLFATISNEDFYVWGPELNSVRGYATPRQQTWDAVTALDGVAVPYRYDRGTPPNEQQFYEICGGDNKEYLMCINNEGVLTSCTRKDRQTPMTDTIPLIIPDKVGEREVTAIGPGCFGDDELNQHIHTLTINDNSQIASIAASVFENWKELKKVYIGNSITEIGANAFAGCEKLIDVTFSSPVGGHESVENFGENAFKTGSSQLTFHGDIVQGYAPFKWAMDKDNIIKEPDGIRVCYQSLSPTFLMVMYDENTDLVTLLDYPKMSQVSSLLNEVHAEEIRAGRYGTYEHMREMQSYADYAEVFDESGNDISPYATRRAAFKSDWTEHGEEAYDYESYGPWITEDFVNRTDWSATAITPGTSDDSTDTATAIADFLFEPITVNAAASVPDAYYTRNPFVVGSADSAFPALNGEEIGLLEAVQDIVVPEGVDSIDVYNYYHNPDVDDTRNRNRNNAAIYLEGKLDWDVWRMYSTPRQDADGSVATQPGLFSGYYDDGLTSTTGEQYKRGNDHIRSVTLNSVKYLPDYAFDSCENLISVDLGPACSDIGIAPFRGCYEMETVGPNEWYTTTNGIIYSNNTDGSLTIEECLSARGRKSEVGPGSINVLSDENLKKVSTIKPGAFEDCDFISEVNFGRNDTAGLTVIPENCFKNCDNLAAVYLPVTTNDVGRGAFANTKLLRDLWVYGNEVKISGSAFNNDPEKMYDTNVHAYEDSSARRYAEEYKSDYRLNYVKLENQWLVSFYDANNNLLKDLEDDQGNPIDNPQYVEDGKTITIPKDPTLEGWTFSGWIGLDGATIKDPVRKDLIFRAQGEFDSDYPVDGCYRVMFIDSQTGKLLASNGHMNRDGYYYVPINENNDQSFASLGWTEPPHDVDVILSGKGNGGFSNVPPGDPKGMPWTVDTAITGNWTIAALYEGNPNNSGTTSGSSTSSGTTSGGTTNTSGGTTSSSSSQTSSSRTSSSSSSSSSTSTSSTTSEANAAAFHRVTVVGGSGSGMYKAGDTVVIAANEPAAGMKFTGWTGEVEFNQMNATATLFVMPDNDVLIVANFEEGTAPTSMPTPAVVPNSNTNTGQTAPDNGNTRVDIMKPGISNRDLATANVNGSTDNFVVKISETDEATRAVAAALTNKYGTLDNILYYAMDITLWDSTGTTQISDTTGLSVDITIPIPDSLVAYGGNNMAGAVINGDQLESLNENFTTINGVPCIRFRATHFSPYTIYVDTGNLVEGMLDTTPQTGDPIHPKWFLSLGLACLSMILFLKRDKKTVRVKKA